MTKRANGEGTIYQRPDGRWTAQVSIDGARKTLYGKSQGDVRRKLDAAKRAMEEGRPVIEDRRRLGEYLDDWLRDVIGPSDLSPKTKSDYRDIVRRQLVPALGRTSLVKLRPQQVQQFLNAQREKGYSPRSVQYHHAVLRRALNQAVQWEILQRNPAERVTVPRPRTDDAKVHAISVEDAHKLLDAAVGDRLEGLYLLCLSIGLRRGEALGLRWADLDLGEATLSVVQQVQWVPGQGTVVVTHPKTKRSRRTVRITDDCVKALRVQRTRQAAERLRAGEYWQDHGLVFPSSIGTPLDPRNLTRAFHSLCDRAGLPRERLHNLRHSAASFLLAQGVPLRVVMEILGHSSIQMTADLYTHVVPALEQDAAERIGKLLRRPASLVAVEVAVNGPQM